MLSEGYRIFSVLTSILSLSLLSPLALAQPNPSVLYPRADDPLEKEDPLRDPAYLPAQIGGIVGAYAVSLVLVAITLLALSKKRREHLSAGNDEIDFLPLPQELVKPSFQVGTVESLVINTQVPPAGNFSYQSPTKSEFDAPGFYIHPSPVSASTVGCPGVSPLVDQRIVAADRVMAQSQLEEMYKHVMEHEDAKKRGVVYEAPIAPSPVHQPRSSASGSMTSLGSVPKKERTKPANLNLSKASEEKTQSRTSSLLSALRSPKKKAMRGVSISSPIMTPQSATFPRQVESQEMNAIPPRHYAPPPPPPVPTDQVPFGAVRVRNTMAPATPPDISPESVQSIDERIEAQLPLPPNGHNRSTSMAPTEGDPQSASSEHSQAPLVTLPKSPKPGARFPTLPASPKPGATFHRSNVPLPLRNDSASSLPSAVRTGGALPLRAYDTGLASPSITTQTTKQTVFERKPLSPSGAMTPYTAGIPYSPYQPFTPCMPMTPSLITREDRKRMKRMVPKTPTLEMVRAAEDIW